LKRGVLIKKLVKAGVHIKTAWKQAELSDPPAILDLWKNSDIRIEPEDSPVVLGVRFDYRILFSIRGSSIKTS